MAKRKQVSSESYQREAVTRVAAFSAATIVAAAIGLGVAIIVLRFFPGSSVHVRDNIFGYSWAIAGAIVCAIFVYQIDQVLNDKFSQNP